MTTRIIVGDALASLKSMPSGSVHMICTSPPYFGLRSYLPDDHPDKALEMGSEPTLAEFIAALVGLMREARRVLRDDGVAFLNMGDGYARDVAKGQHKPGDSGKSDYIITEGGGKAAGGMRFRLRPGDKHYGVHMGHCDQGDYEGSCCYGEADICPALEDMGSNLKPKDLMMVPARLAIALQDDGWFLRSQMPWIKRSCMPESVVDRPTSAIEYVFLLTKRPTYFWDAEAVKVAGAIPAGTRGGKASAARAGAEGVNSRPAEYATYSGTRNFRNSDLFFSSLEAPHGLLTDADGEPVALDVNTAAFPGAHFATFPQKLVDPLIRAGTSEKGCCPACGAPWVRVVEKRLVATPAVSYGTRADARDAGADANDQASNRVKDGHIPGMRRDDITLGWQPSCSCPPADPVPCTVLDPFAGAATTLMVAERLGRDSIGLELNPKYVAMAETRLLADRGALPIEGVGLFAALAAAD